MHVRECLSGRYNDMASSIPSMKSYFHSHRVDQFMVGHNRLLPSTHTGAKTECIVKPDVVPVAK